MPTHPETRRARFLLFLLAASLACAERPTEPGQGPEQQQPPQQQPPRPEDRLPGAAADPAAGAVSNKTFEARAGDYIRGHPRLPRVPLSFNTVMIALNATATVGDVNALLDRERAEIVGGIAGVAGQAGAILFLRLPTGTHAEVEAALGRLRQRPDVVDVAVQDGLLGPAVITQPNAGAAGWAWDQLPAGGNWGMEASRVPQMWNLNGALLKTGLAAVTRTAVFDAGFAEHPDVTFQVSEEAGPPDTISTQHGTHVSGTIGATFDNQVGVDGVTPFAQLLVRGHRFGGSPADTTDHLLRASLGAQIVSVLHRFIADRPEVRVINVSLAYNWSQDSINTTTDSAARAIADLHGAIAHRMLTTLAAAGRRLPVIVVAAGNDSQSGLQSAAFASPLANAALRRGAAPIIVVEAVSIPTSSSAAAPRAAFSNSNGHVSAPGVAILSTAHGSGYRTLDGTSMASPHVTGLVSYLYSIDPEFPAPTMTANAMRAMLAGNAVPSSGGAAPRIDAFATAMDLDRVRGGDRVLRMLVDVDDGTLDGNQRTDSTGANFLEDDADGDGGRGDGRIDMRDFRRWRDWLLQVESAGGGTGLALDGSADHPKKDLDGDGRVGLASEEMIYARGDFNGDGILDRVLTRPVPGVMGNQRVTDLQLLQRAFADSAYAAAELPSLIESGDISVDASACLALPNAVRARSSVRVSGTPAAAALPSSQRRVHDPLAKTRVYTLAVHPAGYTVRVEALSATDSVLGSAEQAFPVTLGGDRRWVPPECGHYPRMVITAGYGMGPALASCVDRRVQPAVVGSSLTVANTCDFEGRRYAMRAASTTRLTAGTLEASMSVSGATTRGFVSGNAGASLDVLDRVLIDAPGLTGTQGTFTARVEIFDTLAVSGPCGLDVTSVSWFVRSHIRRLDHTRLTATNVLPGHNGGLAPCGSPAPVPAVIEGAPGTFTYGTPFEFSFRLNIQASHSVQTARTDSHSAGGTLTYRWLGMSGLPAGATATSASGVNWAAAAP